MNKNNLHITELEKDVINSFLENNKIGREFFGNEYEYLNISKREMTGVGFYTDLQTNKTFKEENLKSLRWSKIGARLNNKVDIGFVVYVDDYKLHCIEGFTYGTNALPQEITSYTIVDLDHKKS